MSTRLKSVKLANFIVFDTENGVYWLFYAPNMRPNDAKVVQNDAKRVQKGAKVRPNDATLRRFETGF